MEQPTINISTDQISKQIRAPGVKRTDVFDAEDFDATKFVNQIYPDESSLGDLDKFVEMLRRQIRTVDKEIFSAVRQQSGAHSRARQDLSVAHGQIQELFTKMHDIQRKAEETETMVQEICRDIKKLDHAKKHLTNAITALRRLAMLTAAISELEQVGFKRDQYKKCANLLEAVGQLMEFFQAYEAVPKIKALTKRLGVVQQALQAAVLDDFKILMGTADSKLTTENLERLSNACLVVNALGPKVREQLLDWLCEREMTIYQTIFSVAGEGAKLDRFDRRYQWFRARLEEKKEQWAIFPEAWRVPQTLCLTFCKLTRAHLKRVLSDGEEKPEVAPLIKTVVATNKFEKEMAQLFGGGTAGDDDEDDLASEGDDNLPASEARRRLEAYRKRAQAAAAAKAAAAPDKSREAAEAAKTAFEGSISEAFEGALKLYVAEEERELGAHLEALMKEERDRRWAPADDDSSTKVLQSANKVFLKIRSSLTRCVKLVSRGPPLLALAEVFKKILSSYASELTKRLPRTAGGSTTAAAPYTGSDWQLRLGEEEEKVVCHILATAEFCRETTESLAAAVAKDVKPGLSAQVDMSDQESAFVSVASQCMSVLVLGINTRLDAALQEMCRVRWDMIEQPGDDSVFVSTARKVLQDCAPRLGQDLDRTNFSFLCDKMARMFVPRFYESVYRLRKISEKGTLQLSIDADAVKRALLDFPRAARPMDDESEASAYCHYVEREMGQVVAVVKVLQAKPENLVETFLLLMPAPARTAAEFQRVCDLKVLSKKQQGELAAAFQRKVGGGEPLAAVPAAAGLAAVAPAASNLSAFKLNVNNFTRELASTLNRSRGPDAGVQQAQQAVGSKPAIGQFGKNLTATAQRTRDSLAKVTAGLAGKLAGVDGSGLL